MLSEIQRVLDDPEEVPTISKAAGDYLMVRCNYSYLQRTGVIDDLKRAGFSEQYILGFVDGIAAIPELIEFMQNFKKEDPDDVL